VQVRPKPTRCSRWLSRETARLGVKTPGVQHGSHVAAPPTATYACERGGLSLVGRTAAPNPAELGADVAGQLSSRGAIRDCAPMRDHGHDLRHPASRSPPVDRQDHSELAFRVQAAGLVPLLAMLVHLERSPRRPRHLRAETKTSADPRAPPMETAESASFPLGLFTRARPISRPGACRGSACCSNSTHTS
jgi:hypothetical protein